jgi:VanZ family protein
MMVLAIVVIAYGTLSPSEYLVPSRLWSFDKVLHFSSFGTLTGLIWLHLYKIGNTGRVLDVKALFWGIFAGLLVEMLQYYLPINRLADALDFMANVLGSITAVGFLKLIGFNRQN